MSKITDAWRALKQSMITVDEVVVSPGDCGELVPALSSETAPAPAGTERPQAMIRRDSFLGQAILALQGKWPDRTAETSEQRDRAICATCDDSVDEWVTITWQLTRRHIGRTDGKEYADLCMTCVLTLGDKMWNAFDCVINAHKEYLKGGTR